MLARGALRLLRTAALAAAVLSAMTVPAAHAQRDAPLDPTARRTLRPAAARLAESLPASAPSRRMGPTRVDARGRIRADYRLAIAPTAGASPEAAARAVLAAGAARYGLDPALAALRLDTVVNGTSGASVRFQQVARLASGEALPVVGRGATVTLGPEGRALAVAVNAEAVGQGVPAFALSPEAALDRVRDDVLAVPGAVRLVERAAFVGTDASVRPAYVVDATPDGVPTAWRSVVDGQTGALLHLSERSVGHRRASAGSASRWLHDPESAGPRRTTRPVESRASSAVLVDGSGLAFVPDPLTSAGVAYGTPGYVDGGDADTPELSAQRREVALPQITQSGGRVVLVGPYVEITGEAIAGGIAAVVPSETSPTGFRYARSDPRFESVMAYHHLDASQRYVQRLALGRPIRERPVRVNPRGMSDDDSRYVFDQNALLFGTGAIDDAEDADVIWHEYGHVLLNDQTPGLFESFEARALHEGWSDYWAATYSRRLMAEGRVPAHDWRRVYSWDGNAGCWQGRRLDHPGVYGATDRSRMGYPATPGCAPFSTLYQWGLLWATTLAEVQTDVGIETMDRLVVASLAMLGGAAGPFPAAPPMEVAAEALIAADRALYGGAHEGVLVARLGARGFVDLAAFGPVVRHTPLAPTEQAGGTRRVEVDATSSTSTVAAVRVVLRVDGGAVQTLALAPVGGERWAGDLPLPAGPATVAYAVEAEDAAGRRTRLPVSTDSSFAFQSGPDRVAPSLAHAPALAVPRGAFPLRLVATVADALGVDTVVVDVALERGGAVVRSGRAGLARTSGDARQGTYVGTVPIAQADVRAGDVLVYTVRAIDRAAAANTATSGPHRVPVVAEGVVASFTAEADEGVALGGAWQRGHPTRFPGGARAGQGVYATGLTAPYPATAGASVLALPPLDLSFGPATLAFWYWIDAEAGDGCGAACDGGQVQVSTDGGRTWRRLALASAPGLPRPDADTLTVVPSSGAVLDGPRVIGSWTLGWQRATAALPAAPAVRVRFVFVTDAGNVFPTRFGFGGWALDSITVSTQPPPAPPAPVHVAVSLPEVVGPGEPIAVQADLDTDAAADVRAIVRVRRAGAPAVLTDSVRLVQDPVRLRRFTGRILQAEQAGDAFEVEVRVTDVAGQVARGSAAVPVRLRAQADALAGVAASGLWRTYDGLWIATAPGDGSATPPASSLVLPPRAIPANADAVRLVVRQRTLLQAGAGGVVEASTDDGASWQLLVPTRAYPGTLDLPGHPLHGSPTLVGRDTAALAFDLSGFRGQTVRLRARLVTGRDLAVGEYWEVESARVELTSPDGVFDAPAAFAVSRPFPNPFGDRLAFAVTLPEPARLDVHLVDALGRRVAVLADGTERDAGTHALTADVPGLAAGVYVLVVRAGRDRWTGTVVKR